MDIVYRLNHTSKATGKDTIIAESSSIKELRKEAAIILLSYYKLRGRFKIVESGRQWELSEPEVCSKCPDESGVLTISEMIPELKDNNISLWS